MKKEILQLRMTQLQKQKLKALAYQHHCSMTDYVLYKTLEVPLPEFDGDAILKQIEKQQHKD